MCFLLFSCFSYLRFFCVCVITVLSMVSSVILFVSVSLACTFFSTLWLCYLPVLTIHYFLQLISSYFFPAPIFFLVCWLPPVLPVSIIPLPQPPDLYLFFLLSSLSLLLTRHPPGHNASSLGSLCFSSTFTLSLSLSTLIPFSIFQSFWRCWLLLFLSLIIIFFP